MKRNIQIFKKIYFFSKNRIPKIHHFDIFDNFVSFIIKFRKNAKKLNFKKFKINNSSLLNLPIKCIYVYIYVFYIRLKLNHFCCTNDIVAFTCSRVGTKYCDRQSGIYMKIWNFLITLSPCLILHTRPVLQFFTT